MKKFLLALFPILVLSLPLHAQLDAETDAAAVFDTFLTAMTNADTATVTSLFFEDALFWGTGSKTLVTTPAGVAAYFAAVGRNEPGATVARAMEFETRALSDSLVMISGMWEILPSGQDEAIPMRVSMLLARLDGVWKIIQFHNSRVPD